MLLLCCQPAPFLKPAAASFLAVLCLFAAPTLRAADPLVDGAVNALAQLTDPHRLEALPDPAFRAQLGPALGWLHVARRQDVAPESVIGRAFALNGLDSERAHLTREALLRNLARADAWELFTHENSARALADGRPAPILTGIHRGHLAQTAIILPTGLGAQARREFACLVLRADDEPALPTAPSPTPRRRPRRQAGDMLARALPTPAPRTRRPGMPAVVSPTLAAGINASPAFAYDDALPVAYTTLGQDSGAINVRVAAHPGQPVDLAAYGGPTLGFLLRSIDAGGVRFSVLDGKSSPADVPVRSAPVAGAMTRAQLIYEQAGTLRVSLCGLSAADSEGARTFLFEFPVARTGGAPVSP